MKKVAILVAMALVFSLVAPAIALAAGNISVSGKLSTELKGIATGKPAGDPVISGQTLMKLNIGIGAENEQKVKAYLELAPSAKTDFTGWLDRDGNVGFTDLPNLFSGIKLNKAYLQADGPYWADGPAIRTTIGDVTINQNDYVANLGGRKGISVEGIKAGPVGMDAFWVASGNRMIFPADDNVLTKVSEPVEETYGGRINANIMGADLGASVVKVQKGAEYALNGKFSPIPMVTLDGVYARDAEQAHAYKVNAAVSLLENLTLRAGYRGADKTFNPVYALRKDSDDDGYIEQGETDLAAHDRLTGFNVGASTQVYGVNLAADYDNPTKETDVKADTELAGYKLNGEIKATDTKVSEVSAGVEKSVELFGMDVTGNYTAAISDTEISHEVKASSKLSVLPLTLDGRVKMFQKGSEQTQYEANATYEAPNGVTLGLKYLNDKDHTMGQVSATAGMSVEF